MEVDSAYDLISSAIDCARPANGYLVCGGKAECAELEGRILRKLFPDEIGLLEAGTHPDVIRLLPSGKRHEITVDDMRTTVVVPMGASSYCGGWKVAVINSADRMNVQSSNALLKCLEEPPAKSLFFLTTDSPDAILPTILSRVQRIDLPRGEELLEGEEFAKLIDIFEGTKITGVADRMRMGTKLAQFLEEILAEAEDSGTMTKMFFKTLISIVRRWMIDGKLERFKAFRNVEAVEEAAKQCSMSINKEAVLCHMVDRMFFS
jgi:hypothetical protein